MPGQEDGKERGKGREGNRGHRKTEVKTALSSTPCGGKKCNGASGGQDTMFYRTHGKNDVKATMYNAWQISPICRILFAGAFCSTEPSLSTLKIMVGSCRRSKKGSVLPRCVRVTEIVNTQNVRQCNNSSPPKTSRNAVGTMEAPTWKQIGTQENHMGQAQDA